MNYDVIGDIHGEYDKLVSLLQKLGYQDQHMAIFAGDLIDRGSRQVVTVTLIRRMVEAGTAKCVMGNHEFNAIA